MRSLLASPPRDPIDPRARPPRIGGCGACPAPTTFKAHSPRRCPMLNSNPGPAEQHPVLPACNDPVSTTGHVLQRRTAHRAHQSAVEVIDDHRTRARSSGGRKKRPRRLDSRGGLAPWQVKKLKVHILARIAFPITCAELGPDRPLELFPTFSRSFKTSLKETPHAFVLRTRIERSCALMRSTPCPRPE